MSGLAGDAGGEGHYSEAGLHRKLAGFARAAGRKVVEKAVLLYLILREPGTPAWARSAIIGALGYFILPLDAVPDLIPGVGFTDDLGILAMALGTVATLITPGLRDRARELTARWLDGSPPTKEKGWTIEVEAMRVDRSS